METKQRSKNWRDKCQWVRHIPTPIGGLALGVASLGWALENVFAASNQDAWAGYCQWFGAALGSLFLCLLILKVLVCPTGIWQDLRDPVVGASLPGASMALMVIANSIGQFYPDFGIDLWIFAIGLHLLLMVLFVARQAPVFGLDCVNPGWFVPFVGVITACVAYPKSLYFGLEALQQGFETDMDIYLRLATALLWWGLACYAILLPWIMYRLIWGAHLTPVAMPSVAVLAAPGSLALAGYLTISPHPSPLIVSLLFGIASLMTVSVYTSFIKLLRLPFTPGFSAFTFPLVISATALFKLSHWIKSLGMQDSYVNAIQTYAKFELAIAFLIVCYVSYKYTQYLLLKTKALVR